MIGQAKRLYELQKIYESKAENVKLNSTFIFTSGKGGTGKTFICANIAFALAEKKKKVLLIDFNLQFANLHILLNSVPEKTLKNFFKNESIFSEIIFKFNDYLDIVYGELGEENNFSFTENDIEFFVNKIKKIQTNYDFILIDTFSGANDLMISLMKDTAFNIIVSNPEPTALMDAYVIVKMLNQSYANGKKLLIINKSLSEKEALVSLENLNKAINHFLNDQVDYIGTIPFDEKIIHSFSMLSNQEIIVNKNNNFKIYNAISNIADKLINIKQVANNNQREF
ncbi:MAG: MinD/ParA family protein [Ignavibacterium sp.]